MHGRQPVILITGFGPFPGQPRNASSELAQAVAMAARRHVPGYAVTAATLPTEWDAGPRTLDALLIELQPAVALHFGVSSKATGFVIETRACNVRAPAPDACGTIPGDRLVNPAGPSEHPTTLPARLILERLRRMGHPARLSRDAGAYLCNAILYHSLAEAGRNGGRCFGPGMRRGFIHIPDRLHGESRAAGRRAVPALLDWDGAVAGALEIVSVCAGAARYAAHRRSA